MQKVWFGLLGIFGIGAGIGFFAGERYGRKQALKNKPAEEEVREKPKGLALACTDASATMNDLAESLGYIPEEDEMEKNAREMDKYLAGFEHPEDGDETDKEQEETHQEVLKDCVDVYYDEDIFDSETEYTCTDLTYYLEDEVLCDENEKRIEDPEELVGPDALHLLEESNVPVIYAKNHWNEHFYRITAIPNAYGRVVLGLEDQ